MRYGTVVFDLDGTLVDSYQALTTALNGAAREHGLRDHSSEDVRYLVGEGVERLLERAFGRCDAPLLSAFERHYLDCFESETKVLAEVPATLQRLASLGLRLGVCTNKPTRFSRGILAALDLQRFFSAIVGPDAAGATKPDPRHLLFTIDASGGQAGESLMVGDMPIDVRAARGAGCSVAAIATGSSTIEQLRDSQPDYLLERFSDLIGLFDPGEVSR